MDKRRNEPSFREKLRYWVDNWLSRGALSTICLLFAFTGLIVVLLGLVSWILERSLGLSLAQALWNSLVHTFDPGVLAGDTGTVPFLFLMLLATLCGMFFTALLIGFINDGIRSRMEDLAMGTEPVIENGHVIILGFNESVYILLGELIEANRNQRGRRCSVVVLGDLEKPEMEERIRRQIGDTANTHVICRSGSITDFRDLERCSIRTCQSVIINTEKDFDTIRAILACTQIFNEVPEDSGSYVTAVINSGRNALPARIAGYDKDLETGNAADRRDRLELLLMETTVARIMTHTCRQTGLSKVFTELFDFAGDEFYIIRPCPLYEDLFAAFTGRTIREINRCLPSAIAIGIIDEKGMPVIDDPCLVRLEEGCSLILLEEDDDRVSFHEPAPVSWAPPVVDFREEPIRLLIMECNPKLPLILREIREYIAPGSVIYIAGENGSFESLLKDEDIEGLIDRGILAAKRDERSIYDYDSLSALLDEARPDFILTLSDHALSDDEADEKSLTLLLYLEQYQRLHPGVSYRITSEMRRISNQVLAQKTMASDFVISRNISSLMMAQISQNRELKNVFESLLESDGYEIYMKSVRYYFSDPGPVDFYSILEAAAEKKEVFIGYRRNLSGPAGDPVCNPAKRKAGRPETITLAPDDYLIVLARDQTIS